MQDLTTGRACLGIIAGAGPEAGLVFWRQALDAVKRLMGDSYRGDLDAPRVRIISEPDLGHVMALSEKRGELGDTLHRLLTELDRSCDRIVVACHGLQELAADCGRDLAEGKLVSLPVLARDHVRHSGVRRIGIFGAPFVAGDRARSPYCGLWTLAEVEPPADPAAALDLIRLAKKSGAADPAVQDALRETLLRYRAETILMACTDFSGLTLAVPGKTVVDILDLAANHVAGFHASTSA